MLQNYFDKIFCINLDRRTDRWEFMQGEFNRIGIDVERVSAIDGNTIENKYGVNKGNLGCAATHLSITKTAKELGLKNYLVFEDDACFKDGFIENFTNWFKEVPGYWDMLYLGANHHNGHTMITEHVATIYGSYTTHAFAATSNIYDAMIDVWKEPKAQVDVCLSGLHPHYNCYSFVPNLVYQKEGYSDIECKHVDYSFLKEK